MKQMTLYDVSYFLKYSKIPKEGKLTILESSRYRAKEAVKNMSSVDKSMPIKVRIRNKNVYAKLGL